MLELRYEIGQLLEFFLSTSALFPLSHTYADFSLLSLEKVGNSYMVAYSCICYFSFNMVFLYASSFVYYFSSEKKLQSTLNPFLKCTLKTIDILNRKIPVFSLLYILFIYISFLDTVRRKGSS